MKDRGLRRGSAAAAKRPRYWGAAPIWRWFAGERARPITARIEPFPAWLDELWDEFVRIFPDAKRPADWPNIVLTEAQRKGRRPVRAEPKWFGKDGGPTDVGDWRAKPKDKASSWWPYT